MLNILLVDDDKDTLRLVQKYFEKKGAHVSAYSNPLLALQNFMENNKHSDNSYYDLVISDIRMPEMNGIELASIIRKMDQDIPIILMTASSIANIDKSILKILNIEDIFTKPIKLKDLLEKINTVKQQIIVK
ncbi:MAG TPA: response regulator [Nitrososphaeraceae archaeon]|nr:response regulator [Nitrososphaeraceae archaeon]